MTVALFTPQPRPLLLGKKDPVPLPIDPFKAYLTVSPPPPPAQVHYGGRVTHAWGMDGNGPDPTVTIAGVPPDWGGCGNCVVCGCAHADTISDWEEGKVTDPIPTSNSCVLDYCALAGCTPAELFNDPGTYDTGLDISTTLLTWHKNGLFGVEPGLCAPIDYTNLDDIKSALWLAGSVVVGGQIQEAQENQFPGTWRWVPGSPILGGHCFLLTGYTTAQKMFWGVSWGALIGMTEDFLTNSLDEAYAVVSAQAIKRGTGPTGLNISKLDADLNAL
jgi:hypothetical protein